MNQPETGLINPSLDDEEIHPYRRVWPNFAVSNGIFFGSILVIFLFSTFVPISSVLHLPLGILLALLPLGLWGIFDWFREQQVERTRERLIPTLLVSALVANAIGYPLVEQWLDVGTWGPQQDLVIRIFVYSLAIGTIPEVLKYIVVRYLVWLDHFRFRADAVAYNLTATVGYITVMNLQYILNDVPPVDVAAVRIFGMTTVAVTNSLIVAYGLAEMRFERTSPLLLPGAISVASLVTGVVVGIRGNLSNTRLGLGVSAPTLIIALAISAALLFGIGFAMSFLFTASERQAQEAENNA